MKKITTIILILFLYNCGYSSVYKDQKLEDFKFEINKVDGDKEMNNLIKNEIRLYSNKNSKNIYNLGFNTDYKKEILTKDSSGIVTDYSLSVKTIFTINFRGKTQIIQFEENINIKNQVDRFEQDAYELNIKRNFASSIREKLMSSTLNLDDN